MTVKQCDRCKKIVVDGYIVVLSHKEFRGYAEEREFSYKTTLDFCESCCKLLKTFLGVNDEK